MVRFKTGVCVKARLGMQNLHGHPNVKGRMGALIGAHRPLQSNESLPKVLKGVKASPTSISRVGSHMADVSEKSDNKHINTSGKVGKVGKGKSKEIERTKKKYEVHKDEKGGVDAVIDNAGHTEGVSKKRDGKAKDRKKKSKNRVSRKLDFAKPKFSRRWWSQERLKHYVTPIGTVCHAQDYVDDWYVGYVQDSRPGEVWIRFDGYGSADNTWFANSSTKLAPAELTTEEREEWKKIFQRDIEKEARGVREVTTSAAESAEDVGTSPEQPEVLPSGTKSRPVYAGTSAEENAMDKVASRITHTRKSTVSPSKSSSRRRETVSTPDKIAKARRPTTAKSQTATKIKSSDSLISGTHSSNTEPSPAVKEEVVIDLCSSEDEITTQLLPPQMISVDNMVHAVPLERKYTPKKNGHAEKSATSHVRLEHSVQAKADVGVKTEADASVHPNADASTSSNALSEIHTEDSSSHPKHIDDASISTTIYNSDDQTSGRTTTATPIKTEFDLASDRDISVSIGIHAPETQGSSAVQVEPAKGPPRRIRTRSINGPVSPIKGRKNGKGKNTTGRRALEMLLNSASQLVGSDSDEDEPILKTNRDVHQQSTEHPSPPVYMPLSDMPLSESQEKRDRFSDNTGDVVLRKSTDEPSEAVADSEVTPADTEASPWSMLKNATGTKRRLSDAAESNTQHSRRVRRRQSTSSEGKVVGNDPSDDKEKAVEDMAHEKGVGDGSVQAEDQVGVKSSNIGATRRLENAREHRKKKKADRANNLRKIIEAKARARAQEKSRVGSNCQSETEQETDTGAEPGEAKVSVDVAVETAGCVGKNMPNQTAILKESVGMIALAVGYAKSATKASNGGETEAESRALDGQAEVKVEQTDAKLHEDAGVMQDITSRENRARRGTSESSRRKRRREVSPVGSVSEGGRRPRRRGDFSESSATSASEMKKKKLRMHSDRSIRRTSSQWSDGYDWDEAKGAVADGSDTKKSKYPPRLTRSGNVYGTVQAAGSTASSRTEDRGVDNGTEISGAEDTTIKEEQTCTHISPASQSDRRRGEEAPAHSSTVIGASQAITPNGKSKARSNNTLRSSQTRKPPRKEAMSAGQKDHLNDALNEPKGDSIDEQAASARTDVPDMLRWASMKSSKANKAPLPTVGKPNATTRQAASLPVYGKGLPVQTDSQQSEVVGRVSGGLPSEHSEIGLSRVSSNGALRNEARRSETIEMKLKGDGASSMHLGSVPPQTGPQTNRVGEDKSGGEVRGDAPPVLPTSTRGKQQPTLISTPRLPTQRPLSSQQQQRRNMALHQSHLPQLIRPIYQGQQSFNQGNHTQHHTQHIQTNLRPMEPPEKPPTPQRIQQMTRMHPPQSQPAGEAIQSTAALRADKFRGSYEQQLSSARIREASGDATLQEVRIYKVLRQIEADKGYEVIHASALKRHRELLSSVRSSALPGHGPEWDSIFREEIDRYLYPKSMELHREAKLRYEKLHHDEAFRRGRLSHSSPP